MYQLPRAAITKYHKLGDLKNNRKLFSHSSGVQKSEIKVLAKLIPSEVCEGESVPCPSPSFQHPQAFLILPVFSLCLSVFKFPLFMRTKSYWLGAHPNDLILT